MVAFAGYPLLIEDRLVGVMAMFARQPLSEATLGAMASVADSIALGIDRKRAAQRFGNSKNGCASRSPALVMQSSPPTPLAEPRSLTPSPRN